MSEEIIKEFLCDVCNEGSRIEVKCVRKHEYRNVCGYVLSLYWECNNCGCVTTTVIQSRENKRSITSFKEDVDILLKK